MEFLDSLSTLTFGGALEAIWGFILSFLAATWWFWSFFIVFHMARSSWLYWRQRLYEEDMKWVFLEMKIPREILKGPRSMDQLFQGIAALRNAAGDLGEKYIDGEITKWYSFEMCSFGGEVHFYMRVLKNQRPLVEAAFYSYYPEVEIEEVPDYINKLPHNLADMKIQGLDLWGTEMVLVRDFTFPIKSYQVFEDPDEMNQFDPISVFIENLAKAKKGEFVGIQYNIAPMDRAWGRQKHFQDMLDELREPKFSKTQTSHGPQKEGDLPVALKSALLQKTPGQTDVLKAVEAHLAKPAFKAVVRFIYISPKNIFYDPFARRAIKGSFNQYGASDLNWFDDNKKMSTKVRFWHPPFIFPYMRYQARQQRILHTYLDRDFGIEPFMGKLLTSHFFNWNFASREIVLGAESLAGLYHPPSNLVLTAPHSQRIESKKMGAPAGLPIYGDDEMLENFK